MLKKILVTALSLGSLSAHASEAWLAPFGRGLSAKTPPDAASAIPGAELIDLLRHAEVINAADEADSKLAGPGSGGMFTDVGLAAIWTEGVKPLASSPWTEGVKTLAVSPWTEGVKPSSLAANQAGMSAVASKDKSSS